MCQAKEPTPPGQENKSEEGEWVFFFLKDEADICFAPT